MASNDKDIKRRKRRNKSSSARKDSLDRQKRKKSTRASGKNNTEDRSANSKVSKKSAKNDKKGKKLRFKDKHPKLTILIRLIIVFVLLITVVTAGIFVGYIYGFFGDDFKIDEAELKISASNSVVVNSEGAVLADLSGDEKRKIISIDEMADYLPKAYVSIEDERFYKHHGVDIKRTAGAIMTYAIKKNRSYGGSTITQQLVKNITKEDDRSVFRKVKEWAKAYQVEKILSKDEILELYLNILFVGGNNYGVELGAEYYFNKTAKDLDLAECAFLAGINNSPNAYNPYDTNNDHTELIKNRTKTVLKKMKELGAITSEEDYNQAVAKVDEGLKFEKAPSKGNLYSYHTDALLTQVIEQVAEEKQISKQLAENYIYSGGLTIYSTQNDEIQSAMEMEFSRTDKYSRNSKKTKNEDGTPATTQAAMVVIDNSTGYVLGTVGGLGSKSESRGLNRATQSTRQTGSSMKPLSAVVPGLEEGIITAATEYDDAATKFPGNYEPKNYNRFRGVITVRDAIETSQNIPFIKVVAELTPAKSMEYLKKMGITSLDDTRDNVLPLAIGGLTNGVSPLEMAGAYATIANDGTYIEPTFYSKVTDSKGEVVLEPKQKTEKVMSEANAYIAKNILTAPVVGNSGTAKYCAIPGKETAAKTGTTNDDYDRWLCGFTTYYTAATWYGFDRNEEIVYSGTNPAGLLWSNVMKTIHKNLPNSNFVQPAGIVKATICTASGGTAKESCSSKRTEVFVEGTVPAVCEGHSAYEICKESGMIATEFCPEKETRYFGYNLPKEKLGLWKTSGASSGKATAPAGNCTIHFRAETPVPETKENKQTSSQDSSAPSITFTDKKGTKITINVGDKFDAKSGYEAKDDKDGDITSKVNVEIVNSSGHKVSKVDTSKAETYTLTYTVQDSSGNKRTVKRTVKVVAKDTPKPTPTSAPDTNTTPTPDTPEDPGTEQ